MKQEKENIKEQYCQEKGWEKQQGTRDNRKGSKKRGKIKRGNRRGKCGCLRGHPAAEQRSCLHEL